MELKSVTLSLGSFLGVHKEYEPVAKSIVKNILSKFGFDTSFVDKLASIRIDGKLVVAIYDLSKMLVIDVEPILSDNTLPSQLTTDKFECKIRFSTVHTLELTIKNAAKS